MMRISASTVAFPGVPLDALPGVAAAAGVEAVAVGVSDRSALSLETPVNEVKRFSERCRACGLQVSAIYGYAGRKLTLDEPARQQDIDQAKRCVDLSVLLQARVVRVFAATAPGTTAEIDRFVEACQPIARYAGEAGAMLSFPTHHDLASDPGSCRRLVEGLGRARAGIIFNGSNMEMDGIEPLGALEKMFDLVEQVELKDWRRRGDAAELAAIGAGDATVWPIVEALADAAFDGWITLHHLKQHDPGLADLHPSVAAAVRRIARRVGDRRSHVAD
ncbi:MAG: sugar phosphate isomerase/epimerase [Alphaproteobacteria bacterium]|nr:sugar phosphate isomerase/epimerase [Alphaproteobacteria bacterium]